MTKDNNLLGKFQLSGIPLKPRGVPQIEVTFDLDANGILNVNACEKSTGKEQKITITNDKTRLSNAEVERMIREAERYKAEDDANRERIEAKNRVENYIYSVRNMVNEKKGEMDPADSSQLERIIQETTTWLDQHSDSASTDELKYKLEEIEQTCNPILSKAAAGPGAAPGAGERTEYDYSSGGATGGSGTSKGPKIQEVD